MLPWWIRVGVLCLLALQPLSALDPRKQFSQYTRTNWSQAQGLPQDTANSIAQTQDGYMWFGTSEGLVRFDGFEFTTFTRSPGGLPSSSVVSLKTGRDGTLWIGTADGLASYKDGKLRAYGPETGLPVRPITTIAEDSSGSLWLTSGGSLVEYRNGTVHTVPPESLSPVTSVRTVYLDHEGTMWVAGVGGLVKRSGKSFVPVLGPDRLGSVTISSVLKTKAGLWLGGAHGVIHLAHNAPDRTPVRLTARNGLPDDFVLELSEDRNGTVWIGTDDGVCRMIGERCESPPQRDSIAEHRTWAIFEDREGNMWIAGQGLLVRLRDDPLSIFGRPEGLPGDKPTAVHEDRAGRIWVGFHGEGFMELGSRRVYTTRDGLDSNDVFSVRDGLGSDLLISTAGGLSRLTNGTIARVPLPSGASRPQVYDTMIDSRGRIWAATLFGVFVREGREWQAAIPEGPDPAHNNIVTLAEGPDGSIWAGTFSGGLWRIDGPRRTLFTVKDGLGSDQIRSLVWDKDVLWIGTFNGGLSRFHNGKIRSMSAADGLLSDNVAHVDDDGTDLWLSTTKGICRISKQQLEAFLAGKRTRLDPTVYTGAQGLRSAHLSPAFPAGKGGMRSKDGRLWFTSLKGLVMLDPKTEQEYLRKDPVGPIGRIVSVTADGAPLQEPRLESDFGRVEFQFVGLLLGAPESVRYFYKLEGLDGGWSEASSRRISYSTLPPGDYRFLVQAVSPGGQKGEAEYAFVVLPNFYQTPAFLALMTAGLAGIVYAGYRWRLAQERDRFDLVVEERARLAREIHDTLAQGFVGIAHQLDVLAGKLDAGDSTATREQLNLARKMTRHSLTEARRSMVDLRAPELRGQAFTQALATAARHWLAGTQVQARIDVPREAIQLPPDTEQNLFRIAQEAVANALKHARAGEISLQLKEINRQLSLSITDDGIGFDTSRSLYGAGGHFGIIGMHERAERMEGSFSISSRPGGGTKVEVQIPIASK